MSNKETPCFLRMGGPRQPTMRIAAIVWSLLGAALAYLALRWTRVSTWLLDEFPTATRPRFFPQSQSVYPKDVTNLTRMLVPLSEEDAAHYALRWLRVRNLSASLHPVPGGARHNLLALAKGATVADAQVVLSTHFDVVPGGPSLDLSGANGRLVGRGTVDARGIMAAMMVTVAQIADRRVAAFFVTGEETDHAGMRMASARFEFPDSITLINGEPTESKVATSQKGMLKVRITARGVSCHSGYPHLGRSAINVLLDVLSKLRATAWPSSDKQTGEASMGGSTTMNIGVIEGGQAANMVAESAVATVMFRLIGDPREVLDIVEQVVSEFDGTSTEVLTQNHPVSFFVPPKASKQSGTIKVSYNTDVAHFARKYRRAILFGSGSIEVAHTNNESVDVAELEALPSTYANIVDEILELDQ